MEGVSMARLKSTIMCWAILCVATAIGFSGGRRLTAEFDSQSAAMAASSTSFCSASVPKLRITEPGQIGLGLNRSYALLISQNALSGGEKKPQLIYFIPIILLLALWAVLVFRKRKRKK
jgi:hypothetical protein